MTKITVGQAINSNLVGSATASTLIAGGQPQISQTLDRFIAECQAASGLMPEMDRIELTRDVQALQAEMREKTPNHANTKTLLGRIVGRVNATTEFASPIVTIAKDIMDILSTAH